jgi:predicted dehydrogenase
VDADLGSEGVLEGPELLAALHARGIRPRNPDKAFIRSVVSGEPAHPDFADALRAHVLAEVIYRSAAETSDLGGGAALAVPEGIPGVDWV